MSNRALKGYNTLWGEKDVASFAFGIRSQAGKIGALSNPEIMAGNKQVSNKKSGKTITIALPSKAQLSEGTRALHASNKKHGKVLGTMNSVFNPFSGYNLAKGKYVNGQAINAVSQIFGSGDYTTNYGQVSQNACMIPSFKGADSTVISKREYIGDIVSGVLSGAATAFTKQTYPLNPGQSSLFPWLSMIASNYEQYDIQGMVFEFKSTSGDSTGVNTSLGTIIMATQYDPTKPSFQSKLEMEDYFFSSSCKPSSSMLHAIECKNTLSPTSGLLYTRTGASTGADLRWSDFGNFTVATQGMPNAGTVLGELWVSYKVKLFKPRLPITIGFGGQIASAHYNRSGVASNTHGSATVRGEGPLTLSFTGTNTIVFNAFPQMNYLIVATIIADTSVSTFNIAGTSGLSNYYVASSPAATTTGFYTGLFTCTALNPGSVSVALTSVVVGAASLQLFVVQLDETVTF